MAHYRFFVDYLFHSLTSKTRHGVHSPFVYRLVDEVIYDYSSKSYDLEIEAFQSALKMERRIFKSSNSERSNNTGNGAGVLAGCALRPLRVSKLIARLAAFSKPNTIVELGTCSGVTTASLACTLPLCPIVTITGCHEAALLAKESVKNLGINNIEFRAGNVDSLFARVMAEIENLDFLLINDSQSKELTLSYFNACLPKIHEGTLLIFSGIYQSPEMKELWNDIKHDHRVKVTVDLFHIGLVFFKKNQEKENFKIRFL